MRSFGIGTTAVIDSFGGFVKCRIIDLQPDNKVGVAVLENKAGYLVGEYLVRPARYTPPLKCVVVRNGHYRIQTDYTYA